MAPRKRRGSVSLQTQLKFQHSEELRQRLLTRALHADDHERTELHQQMVYEMVSSTHQLKQLHPLIRKEVSRVLRLKKFQDGEVIFTQGESTSDEAKAKMYGYFIYTTYVFYLHAHTHASTRLDAGLKSSSFTFSLPTSLFSHTSLLRTCSIQIQISPFLLVYIYIYIYIYMYIYTPPPSPTLPFS